MVRPKDHLLPGSSAHGRIPVRHGYPLAAAVARTREELAVEVDVTCHVRTGDPASELLSAAHSADRDRVHCGPSFECLSHHRGVVTGFR
ncbi:hypothetical protein B0293_30750 [Amycolatopsis azurea DSM 43854]|uniref:Uncharacterized protein n=1 Tax=Amycolatopsis azurea DSM 43854 TaxID=1238180 RepID=A0ABX3J4D8_9PSEU|nr:hypothetical protein B0293_30750 [Amycolatopsis azurea DSM 43854]